jgi:hypothetical protein
MARPRTPNPTDTVLRVRTHETFIERIGPVAKRNHRSVSQECLYAIEKHVEEEEKRLGLAPREKLKGAHLNEPSTGYRQSARKTA